MADLTGPGQGGSAAPSDVASAGTLAKRDYIILPIISGLTVLILFIAAEAATRIVWVEDQESINSCLTVDDRVGGLGFKRNCVARGKSAEGPWTTYRFNDCGYRSETSCGPVPPGTVRIAILGASVAWGLHVPYGETYYARASGELTRRCKRPVDVQNLGMPRSTPLHSYRHMDEALALRPDVLIYLLAPFDLEQQIDPQELAKRNDPARATQINAIHEPMSLLRRVQILITQSRTVLVAQHYLLQNKDTYLRLYMNYGDKADFLRQPFTSAWQQRFADLDILVGDMAAKAHSAGVPLLIVPVPSRAQAALLSSSKLPPHVDPYAFGRRIEEIANKHGVGYADLMTPYGRIPDSQNLFLIVDGHVTSDGQAVIAHQLAQKLESGFVPALQGCAAEPVQREGG